MSNYQGAFDNSQGSPNLGAAQYIQQNWGINEIKSAVRVEKISVTASGTSGVAATTIPVGAEIIDVVIHPTATSGGGTATLRVGGAGASITNAMTCAVLDTIARATTIDQTYKIVGADGVEIVTNADADLCDAYVYYKK